ncbi:universal stress protein [Dactylosporangium sp. NBC_01737]|uniref:universal stress protein n=1 Tax=Dactylosporangium sp. NBC_01737 TaxID=2975959 RepID=UPI002E119209|nr:universal stress protein [Dactylosporangium sp. NBC_01737]
MEHQVNVVVGVDGSAQSMEAVEWAAADAARRHRRLQIIHACPPHGAHPAPALDEAVARARAVSAELSITTSAPVQPAAVALLDASRWADTVVVGSRGLGGFGGLLLGSVGGQLAAHGACPVVVVRGDGRAGGPEAGRVLVGVDGSHDTDRAMRFAFEQASFRGAGLTAVHTYVWPGSTGPGDILPLVYDEDDLRDDERRLFAEAVAGWTDKFPDVDVRWCNVRGGAAGVLTRLSHGAELLVVGSRGRGSFTGLLLGSVSRAMLHHAACPVAVVR